MTNASVVSSAEVRPSDNEPRLPRWRDVLREQVRATGFVLRRPAQIAAALATLAAITLLLRIFARGLSFDLDAEPSPIYGLIGAVLPIAVWARDERFGPGFLWTLPVDRRQHALTKVLAGWLWLMAGVAVSILGLIVLTLVSGGDVLPSETLHVATAPIDYSVPIDTTAFRTVEWNPSFLIGVVPFAAATICYVIISALWLAARHPFRWVVGAVLAFAVATVASDVASHQLGIDSLRGAPERAVQFVVEERYGLDALLSARTATLDASMRLPSGERFSAWREAPAMSDWGIATLLWGGVGMIALLAAASRHREQRRA